MKKEYENTKILKTDDLKNILGIGRDKAYALMRSEAFPSTKIGRTCFVTEKNLEICLLKLLALWFHHVQVFQVHSSLLSNQ